MGAEEIQVVGNYSSINSLHPKVSIGSLGLSIIRKGVYG
jgi:hypothetical protein